MKPKRQTQGPMYGNNSVLKAYARVARGVERNPTRTEMEVSAGWIGPFSRGRYYEVFVRAVLGEEGK